jgi:hypothetical protein
VALALALGGCAAGRLAGPVGEAVPDPAAFASSLRDQTLPDSPQQLTFGWNLDEQGSRVARGRGVVRTEPAERIRLDLFGPRNETYLIAALVSGQYRLPPEAANAVALPSPSLLWAALGVLDPPATASLSSATATGTAAELRYSTPDEQVFVYSFEQGTDDRFQLVRLERAGRQGIIETVAVDRAGDGSIARTRYRHWGEFRDLTLDVEAIRSQDSFPPNIWRPDAV